MNTPCEDHDWMRWIDGEMSDSERLAFEKRLENEPELRAQVEQAESLSSMLKQELPAEMEVPHGDFFNSQIQVRIAREQAEQERSRPAEKRSSWGGWLAPVAAAAAVGLVALLLVDPAGSPVDPGGTTWVKSSYAPDPTVQARSYHSEDAAATVLILDGLEEIPPQRQIVGVRVDRSELDATGSMASFLSESGEVLLVMARDARQQPHLWAPGGLE